MMKSDQICRACLITNVKMYDMLTNISLLNAYVELTSITKFGAYTHICYECVARVQKCERYRSNCFTAHNLLIAKSKKRKQENNLKCLAPPLTLTPLTITDCQQSDSLIKVIKNENNLEESILDDKIKNEYDNIEIDLIEEDNDYPNACDFEVVSCGDDVSDVKEKNRQKVKKIKKPKKRKSTRSKSIDDEPLSKLIKKQKKNLMSTLKEVDKTVTRNRKYTFDAKAFEDYATVVIMTTEDAKKEVDLRKESKNYIECPFKCYLCYRGYETQKTFTNHVKKHSVDYGEYECEFCRLRFPKRHEYCKHILACHKRKFICKICPYVCYSSSRANVHISLHKGVKYTCEECGMTYNMPNTLLKHKRDRHSTVNVCALCGSTFGTEKGLNAHYALIHKQETNDKKGPQCTECDVHFSSERAWKRHLVLSSKHEVSNGCETCGETFDSNDSLKCHMKSHARKRPRDNVTYPASCTMCSKWLSNSSEYKEHMTSQHPVSDVSKRLVADDYMPCVCEFCAKRFKKESALIYHRRTHTGEKPYPCNVCGKAFSFIAGLSAHKKIHNPVRPVKQKCSCDMCDKTFRSKGALIKHIKVSHLNIRPHSCDVCGKSYHNLCEVKYHKQHVHGNVPWPKRDRSKRTKSSEEHTDLIIDYNG